MSIKCKLGPVLSYYTNNQESVEVNGKTAGECLDHLAKQFPSIKTVIFDEDGKLNSFIAVFVNGRDSQVEHLLRPVKDGDELGIVFLNGG